MPLLWMDRSNGWVLEGSGNCVVYCEGGVVLGIW